MPRENARLKRRPPLTVKASRWWPAILGLAAVVAGFAALMARLEVTQEGLRLSALRDEQRDLEERNRRLRLEVAELGSHERLRAIAAQDGLGPPAAGHVTTMP
ncbi:MAG TPA: hypothetical protein VKS22_14145 [Candidatus Binataceae bacterium]|nr:hypothetical protein [Candidatus Binataceae bacterium]